MTYAVCQIAGKQFKVEPNKEILVPFIGESGDFECKEVLLIADGQNLEIGQPNLNKSLKFTILGISKSKIRGAKFHAKANTRKVWGAKEVLSRVKLA